MEQEYQSTAQFSLIKDKMLKSIEQHTQKKEKVETNPVKLYEAGLEEKQYVLDLKSLNH